jgi:acyl dehydratase
MNAQALARYQVGETFVTPPHVIDESDVARFAEVTGDHHPQHLDAEWAAQSRFGERIVHGLLVVSRAVGLLDLDPERVVAMRSIRDVSFKRPVPVGGTIQVRGHVEAVKELDAEMTLATLALYVLDADERIAVRGRIEALVRANGEAL